MYIYIYIIYIYIYIIYIYIIYTLYILYIDTLYIICIYTIYIHNIYIHYIYIIYTLYIYILYIYNIYIYIHYIYIYYIYIERERDICIHVKLINPLEVGISYPAQPIEARFIPGMVSVGVKIGLWNEPRSLVKPWWMVSLWFIVVLEMRKCDKFQISSK